MLRSFRLNRVCSWKFGNSVRKWCPSLRPRLGAVPITHHQALLAEVRRPSILPPTVQDRPTQTSKPVIWMKWRRQHRIPAIVKQRARNYWDNRITICDKTKQRDKTNSETFKICSCHVFRVKRKKRIGAKWASLQCSSSCNPLTSEKRKSKLAASSNCRPPWHEPSTASGRLFHVASYLSNMRQPVEWICFLFHGIAILLVCPCACMCVCH